MSVLFRDRISGATTDHPGPSPIVGRWQVERPEGEAAFLNAVPLDRIVFLVPDRTNHWDVLSEGKSEHVQGTFPPSQLLHELDVEGILALGGHLGKMADESASFLDWVGESPLIPRISERANLQPLDRFVKEHLGSLEEVCRKPRGHLRREIERLPVARARRIPARAAAHLAAHTEDWERPTLRAVQPKRILASIQDDEWNIYENRIAVRLVDHLRVYLDRRLDELRRLSRILAQVGDHSSALSRTTHWRRLRISKLWGSAEYANEGYRLVEGTLAQITNLRQRAAGLMDSFLYKEVPRNATVANTLRQTNILTSDPRYRRVALLWEEWAKQKHAHAESPSEVQEKRQRVCRGFNDFCFLLVVRAFEQLRYEPEDLSCAVRRNFHCRLEGAHGLVELEWSHDGTIRIDGIPPLRIVPLPASLLASVDEEELQCQIHEMERAAVENVLTLLLYPSPPHGVAQRIGNSARHRLWSLSNDLRVPGTRRLGFLPVSPWDIGSVERVARALRWVIYGSRLLMYPPTVPAPPKDIDPSLVSSWTEMDQSGLSRVIRRPSAQDQQRLDAERRTRREERERCQGRLDDLPSRELDDRRSLADRNRQKSQLNRELTTANQRFDEMDRFCQSLEEAFRILDGLARCPICPACSSSERDFEARDRGTFRRTCPSCRTRWGTLSCGGCSQRYPFLSVDAHSTHIDGGGMGWVDECFGSDVLAVPCAHGQFICPACGHRSCSSCMADSA